MNRIRVIFAAGARPDFIKIAPPVAEMAGHSAFGARLVLTGQHYDRGMAQLFFEELRIPASDTNLGVGAENPVCRMAVIMMRFGKYLNEAEPGTERA
jgi:UDP-N-acetylglucosamine 2-epimerase (non-hydrolysing)